jgi:hypothetical protein
MTDFLYRMGLAPLLLAPLMAAPARAEPPPSVAALGLANAVIATGELGTIRGGFDISPALSISFGFQQIDTVNGIVVQSILVPTTFLTGAALPVTVSDAGGTTTYTPPAGSSVTFSSISNGGQTVISTVLGAGVQNLVTNQANNALIGLATTMTVGVTGMSQMLTQARSLSILQTGITYGNGIF